MALTYWAFLYVAPGLPEAGDLREVTTPASTTVLAGFPTTAAAAEAWTQGDLGGVLERAELVELCGAFDHDHVVSLRRARPEVPVGLVAYAGAMTDQLHALFG